ncbi:ATP synthase F0 subunit A [Candidatus Uhrbacteria bacterium RIFCSPHIGHO2_02_FULL_47_44]|uniref:ATP synthase subunit a n=1 Tax=Candidatus Uhrbacteria bacterium RIFCSPLOWO2_02_FULL_48_18 TaxID=1802408 RepID=A0A1F7VDH7_9BACT|nr:MAG: ATP synthase F0 subunit A [Candidatus Uhrbacteria bacterium RIFCSPHIGHO2_01_FULL_47_10]OGL71510.1 MAG: ATP synthase F0 subunit A [Candidatus Uhrbacteria bacterium RIFCSPHIGHO2_02_FULL_47_44]OGL77689.1 MAG: ATP synthase F0 subunit A [Candidatus Uhrbacteria bacterium RIFCSPHIGHO2_12_FULL_47_12]OGL82378.1 MAG: ATP synthase F0 subunit A [Candidatus Uhrbacteria bacterium RIFCSPLOWO2_01_FULL_47_17]OGL88024.1 MAG: ATP synthase F0 subunit A [Candidatus Uhrbacteria bacterium RIFCSPLOWO2_02_FULL_
MQFSIPPAAAETVFHLGGLSVTNAIINSWVAVVFFVVIAILLNRKQTRVPKGLRNIAEGLVEFMLAEVQKVTGDAKRSRQFLPIVGTIFLFVLFSNWIGLFPGVGSIGVWGIHNGEKELIPFFRSAASDLNLTLAIAAFAVLTSHFIGLRSVGIVNHFSKFVNIRGIWRSLKKGPMAIMVAVIEFGVGLLEIVSELAKVLSLSLRLFGNVFAGEVLLSVMIGLFSFFLPIPFLFLEILVGVIQATVFAMLTLAYLTVATTSHEEHEEEHVESHANAHA